MKIVCLHGYFMFYEDKPGEIALFNSRYNQDLCAKDDYYTFKGLKTVPEYSIKGATFMNLTALETYTGKPFEIFRKNGFVYNFLLKTIALKAANGSYFKPINVGSFNYDVGLVMPGSFSDDSRKITGYTCKFDFDGALFKYTEFYYD